MTRTFLAICPLCNQDMGGAETCVYDGCPTEVRFLTPLQLQLRQAPLSGLIVADVRLARSAREYRDLIVRNRAVVAERAGRASARSRGTRRTL